MLEVQHDPIHDLSLADLYCLLDFVDVDAVLEKQAENLPVRRVELDFDELSGLTFNVDEVMTATDHSFLLQRDNQQFEGG